MKSDDRIYVAGHRGLVGSAVKRRLQAHGFRNTVCRSRRQLDLRDARAVNRFFDTTRPQHVICAAAVVGGIRANMMRPATFIHDNILIATHLIEASHRFDVNRLLFLGSACVYPSNAPQPIPESVLLTGPLDLTNEAYAVAKIAGIKMCQAYNRQFGRRFVSVMPANVYGPGDNFHLEESHVIPGLIRKLHEARVNGVRSVELWGTGQPQREFVYVDDLADACIHVMNSQVTQDVINVGSGEEIRVVDLAERIAAVVEYEGVITFDTDQPDGARRRLLDSSAIHRMGWRARTSLEKGLPTTYRWYRRHLRNTGGG